MINLNDDSFDGGSNVKIFNNGTAGVVENVKLSVKKKTAEDKENAPDYKIIYTDNTGAEVNTAYWYITDATEYSTVEEQIKKQGKVLKHLIHAVYGSDYEFPSYPNPTAMLDGVMKLLCCITLKEWKEENQQSLLKTQMDVVLEAVMNL